VHRRRDDGAAREGKDGALGPAREGLAGAGLVQRGGDELVEEGVAARDEKSDEKGQLNVIEDVR